MKSYFASWVIYKEESHLGHQRHRMGIFDIDENTSACELLADLVQGQAKEAGVSGALKPRSGTWIM